MVRLVHVQVMKLVKCRISLETLRICEQIITNAVVVCQVQWNYSCLSLQYLAPPFSNYESDLNFPCLSSTLYFPLKVKPGAMFRVAGGNPQLPSLMTALLVLKGPSCEVFLQYVQLFWLRKVVGRSARDNRERYCGWFWVHCSSKKFERMALETMDIIMFANAKGKQQK